MTKYHPRNGWSYWTTSQRNKNLWHCLTYKLSKKYNKERAVRMGVKPWLGEISCWSLVVKTGGNSRTPKTEYHKKYKHQKLGKNLPSPPRAESTFNSSFGTTRPHPCSHGTGLLGLNSHSSKCEVRASSFTTEAHPWGLLSQDMYSLVGSVKQLRVRDKMKMVIEI